MFSSRLDFAVVRGVIFRSGHTITTFLLAFKNRKIHGFSGKLIRFDSEPLSSCVSQ